MNPESKGKRLILVLGPTAIGKTDKAIELAKLYKCPIISCDSRQLYKELNIGVAKPEQFQLNEVEHFFINHISIHQDYDAGKFAIEGRLKINELFQQYDNLVICGGTGLYVKALLQGLDHLPGKNQALRTELETGFAENGIQFLQERLMQTKGSSFNSIDIHNPQRIIRAIEIALNQAPLNSELPEFDFEIETETILLEMDRALLYQRINLRVDKMIQTGLENEAVNLYQFRHLNALQTVGYKEWWPYFENQCSKENVLDKIKQHTRNYAKRQMTWFRHQVL